MKQVKISVTGVYEIPESEYHADPCEVPSLSRSIGSKFLTATPRHVFAAHPRLGGSLALDEPTAPMDMGSAIHRLVLGAGANLCVIDAADRRKKETKEAIAAARARGEIPILVADLVAAEAAAASVHAEIAKVGLPAFKHGEGAAEASLVWEECGAWFRARPDWIPTDHAVVYDLKTTRELTSPHQFSKSLADKGYDLQAAMIRAGHQAVFGSDCDVVFVVVEQRNPNTVSLVGMTGSGWDFAWERWKFVRDQWAFFTRHSPAGPWPSWPAHVCRTRRHTVAGTRVGGQENRC